MTATGCSRGEEPSFIVFCDAEPRNSFVNTELRITSVHSASMRCDWLFSGRSVLLTDLVLKYKNGLNLIQHICYCTNSDTTSSSSVRCSCSQSWSWRSSHSIIYPRYQSVCNQLLEPQSLSSYIRAAESGPSVISYGSVGWNLSSVVKPDKIDSHVLHALRPIKFKPWAEATFHLWWV